MQNLRGILYVVLAMLIFTIEDGFNKALSETLPAGQIVLLLGIGGTLIFLVASLVGRQPFRRAEVLHPVTLVRSASEGVATMAFVVSLALVPISTVASVFQAAPLAITLGAALFLGEKVGWRRWTAVLVGFAGVLVIIRPGMAGFQPQALVVLLAVTGIAVRDLCSRRLPAGLPSTVASALGFSALIPAALGLTLVTGTGFVAMDGREWLYMAAAIVTFAVAYYFLVSATRLGDASALTPFRYTRLIFTLILGAAVFGERPDLPTYIGATMIIGSGLYTYLRERRLARSTLKRKPTDGIV
ncbi:DMT family transporter [Pseudooceanicola sp. 502str34]